MARRLFPVRGVKARIKTPDITGAMNVSFGRFEDQYNRAQYWLDSTIMTDMVPFMPMQTGTFINVTRAMSQAIAGTGQVVAAAPPYGRFLYMGKVMVDEKTGSPYARQGAKKVLVSKFTGATNAREDIVYDRTKHKRATSKWFEAAANEYSDYWIRGVRQRAGGSYGR